MYSKMWNNSEDASSNMLSCRPFMPNTINYATAVYSHMLHSEFTVTWIQHILNGPVHKQKTITMGTLFSCTHTQNEPLYLFTIVHTNAVRSQLPV